MKITERILVALLVKAACGTSVHLWKLLWPLVRGRVGFYGPTEIRAAENHFSRLVATQTGDHQVLVSAGTLDHVSKWMKEYWDNASPNGDKMPKITRVTIRHLDFTIIRVLEANGYVESGFEENLQKNIASLIASESARRNKRGYECTIEIRPWKKLPWFHGVILGDAMMGGRWLVNRNSHLHHRETSWVFRKSVIPALFEDCVAAFRED